MLKSQKLLFFTAQSFCQTAKIFIDIQSNKVQNAT